MWKRQTSGSVVCRSCGRLVGVNDATCYECGAKNPALWGYAPLLRKMGADMGFTQVTVGACVVVFGLQLFLDPGGIQFRGFFSFLAPSGDASLALGASGAVPVYRLDRWWTLLSAGWLHGSLLHIFFNMYWVLRLAPQAARFYGPGRTVIVYVLSSVAGFALSSSAFLLVYYVSAVAPWLGGGIEWVMGVGAFTLGASAALMGLLGALIYYGHRSGSSEVGQWAWGYAIFFLVLGLAMRGTDNWAHLGGFVGGWLTGMILDPLKPERLDHLAIAVVLLLASAAAVVVSLITAL
jgi:rhomboid protease GluP